LKVLTSAGDTIRHLPSAAAFSLLVPLPNMWLDAFGASGTGLRRVGYVVDGIVSYALLPGLIALIAYSFRDRRFVPLVLVALGIVTAIVIYGIAVPSQFILARMRLGFYRPLLVIAAVGWVLFLQERFCRRWHRFA
jgi:phosphate starvation-inducible membrane PsiE